MLSYEEWNARIDDFLQNENRSAGKKVPVYRIYCQDDTDRSGGGIYNETVTVDTIGRFARALGDSNPLYSDPGYAAGSTFGGIIAPPLLECCICSTFIGGGFPRLRGLQVFDAGTKWERFCLIRPGDCFHAETTFLGIREAGGKDPARASSPEPPEKAVPGGSASGRKKDRLLLREHAVDLYNQRNEHVSRLTARSIIRCRVPEEASEKVPEHTAAPASVKVPDPACSGRPHYTEEELAGVYENMEAQLAGDFRRGSRLRYWENVMVGEEIPEQAAGPYDESDGQALMAAIGVSNAFATKWGTIRRGRGAGVIDPETGARRLPIDRHSSDLIARAQGLPRALVSGIHSQALLAKSAGDWMGDDGFLRSLDCRCIRPLYYGDLSIQRGKVVEKYEAGGRCFVRLHLEAVRQDGVVHTEAEAVVELPGQSEADQGNQGTVL